MKTIVRRASIEDVGSALTHSNPVLQRIYAARGVRSANELARDFQYLHNFNALRGIEQAVELLVEALTHQQRMLIVADFDADGATSCATLVRGLRLLGAQHVDFIVPNRFTFGYGLTPEIVAVAASRQPDLLITVDNGISSVEGVAAARRCGMKVLITDHHLPGAVLPDANAIVNPNQPNDVFPSKNLAGVGVAFYVLLALRARLRELNHFNAHSFSEPNLAQLLDLVALGTVADVVPLDQCNRILVAQGMARINAGRACAGVAALLEIAGRDPTRVIAADLGFAVAPRLNAAGRLDDMTLGISCLLSDDLAAARSMARQLDTLNRERRVIEERMKDQAFASLEESLLADSDTLPAGLCLFDESWHQGVIGIVASRVKEKMHRPVIAFAPASETEIKGSARSVPGLHIRDVLDVIAAKHPGLLKKFGGHAMAAGMTLARADFDEFRACFATEVAARLSPEDLQGVILSDGELAGDELNLQLAEVLRGGGPWGQGFPEPIFDGIFEVVASRVVGERHLKLNVVPRHSANGRGMLNAIAFNTAEEFAGEHLSQVRLAYKLDVNEYRGTRSPQLLVEFIQPVS